MEGLYFSLVLRPSLPPQRVAPLTLACAVALAEAIESETGLSPLLKWPNDLLLGDRKLSGILLELRADPERVDFVVAGIGLNVSQSSFPDDLAATSLLMETGRPSLRPRILASLLGSLERWIDRFVTEGPAPVIAAFRARAALLGSPVTIHGVSETIEGLYEDIDETGALLLRDSSGALLPILAGDVSLRGPSK
jgi:BirA family biotin operon repressor/biotin-[acetyl-CoA-carboxylase] ligase